MVTNIFRRHQPQALADQPLPDTATRRSTCEEKLRDYEEQLAYLTQQKELHTLALKEMYQFLIKLDTSVREEHRRLHALIESEHERSEKLIEVTKGLWEIIEMMDNGESDTARLIDLTRDVEALAQFDVEVTDESNGDSPRARPLRKMAAAVGAV